MLRCARLLAVIAALPACTAYSHTATIYRNQLPTYEAAIVDGDAEALVVEDEAGGRHRVPRGELNRIDHPGNVLAGFGLVVAALGGLALYDTAFDYGDSVEEREEDRDSSYVISSSIVLVGGIMLFAGGRDWWRSTEAVGRVDPRPGVQPPTVPLVP